MKIQQISWFSILFSLLMAGFFLFFPQSGHAQSRGCDIISFTMSPSGPDYNYGAVIFLDGKSNCGTVKFEIDGQSRSEIGSTNQTMNLNTAEWGAGSHQVCFVARGEGGWENADRRCNTINVNGNPPPPPTATPAGRGCDITSFTMSPAGPNYTLGAEIFLNGHSNCGTVKFEIDGQSRSEIGSTNQTMNLNTSEWGIGSHQVCFVARGNGGWENADRRCNTINVNENPPPPPPTATPAGRGCDITSFTMSPAGPNYKLGDLIFLDGKSNCGTVKFKIDGQSRSEIGSTNQTMNLNTSEWGTGSHQICFVARGNGGWENADRRCNTINVNGNPPPPPPTATPAGRGCDITSFTMSPAGPNYKLGDLIFLQGKSNCGTVKFEIDGQSRSEIGSTNQTINLNSKDWGLGNHQVCFVARGEGGWENADRKCNSINVSLEGKPNPTGNNDSNNSNTSCYQWYVGNRVALRKGAEIRTGSGSQYTVHTFVPEDGWLVDIIDGPRVIGDAVWFDISRKGIDNGGTGWVDALSASKDICGIKMDNQPISSLPLQGTSDNPQEKPVDVNEISPEIPVPPVPDCPWWMKPLCELSTPVQASDGTVQASDGNGNSSCNGWQWVCDLNNWWNSLWNKSDNTQPKNEEINPNNGQSLSTQTIEQRVNQFLAPYGLKLGDKVGNGECVALASKLAFRPSYGGVYATAADYVKNNPNTPLLQNTDVDQCDILLDGIHTAIIFEVQGNNLIIVEQNWPVGNGIRNNEFPANDNDAHIIKSDCKIP